MSVFGDSGNEEVKRAKRPRVSKAKKSPTRDGEGPGAPPAKKKKNVPEPGEKEDPAKTGKTQKPKEETGMKAETGKRKRKTKQVPETEVRRTMTKSQRESESPILPTCPLRKLL